MKNIPYTHAKYIFHTIVNNIPYIHAKNIFYTHINNIPYTHAKKDYQRLRKNSSLVAVGLEYITHHYMLLNS